MALLDDRLAELLAAYERIPEMSSNVDRMDAFDRAAGKLRMLELYLTPDKQQLMSDRRQAMLRKTYKAERAALNSIALGGRRRQRVRKTRRRRS